MDHDEPGNAQPSQARCAAPCEGGLLRATPRPSTREPFPSPPLAPRLGWDDTTTGPECASPSPPSWASLGCLADDARGHCDTTGTAAMPTRTTMQGPGADSPHFLQDTHSGRETTLDPEQSQKVKT